ISEKGHAKNIANLNLLINHIEELNGIYIPSNPKLTLVELQSLYTSAFQNQQSVNTLIAPYSNAVAQREAVFLPLSKLITKLFRVYKSTDGIQEK
ncbi:MAG: hypothetical protein ABI426_00620, partial [Flavobacterium sp.]